MNGLASYIKQAEESTDYQVGDAFDIEFGETQLIETTIVEILEDGIVIQMDSVGLDLMIENNLRLEEKSLSDYDADQEEHFGEGYKVMPPMSDKYQPRDGLEGPFTTLSGKVVYYDQREGSYYDPDTDIYMSYDEFQNYDKDYSKMRNDEDMGSDADEIRLKTASTLDAQEGPVDEAGCSSSRLKELAGLPETTIKDRDAYDASEQGDKKKITLPKAPWEKDKEVNEAEEKPYICVHAKKGKHECHAPTSYEAAKKAAAHWKLKSTSGIDAHLADVEHIAEGVADEAVHMERDHEVQMARSDLYKIANYAVKLHKMLKHVSEEQGIQGWMQAKITKSADYMSSVAHTLEYDMMEKHQSEPMAEAMDASKYHCEDCGCQMHNCKPECNCSHDSHDETGSWWKDADGNGVPDAFESAEKVAEAKAKPQQNLMAKTKALSKITKALTKKK